MPDLSEDLRTYFDELVRHIEPSSASAGGPHPTRRRIDHRLAVVAAVAVVLLVGAVLVVARRQQGGVGVRTGPASTSTPPDRTRLLYTHRSPDGSTVTAKIGIVTVPPQPPCTTIQGTSATGCGPDTPRARTGPGVEFDYVIAGQDYQSVVLDSDPRLRPPALSEPSRVTVVPVFGSEDPRSPTQRNLIILHTSGPVAKVWLAKSGPGGASPDGDQMAPVDGWVTFPIHNLDRLANPEAVDANGKTLAISFPFPCC